MARKVYQFKITLLEIKPLIWRKIVVKPDVNLYDLHKIIQTTMGWYNSHLHQFFDGDFIYAPKEMGLDDCQDSKTVKLNKLLKEAGDNLSYTYDFGDGWEYEILLEEILQEDEKNQLPRCIGGKRNCPPEDCGGPWGYMDFLKIIKNKKHPEYEDMIEYAGENFDPEKFDKNFINNLLMKKDFSCFCYY